jgi:hypothetical protein
MTASERVTAIRVLLARTALPVRYRSSDHRVVNGGRVEA